MVISKRKSITMVMFNKVKDFLKNQDSPVYKTDIVKAIGVDYDSLRIALDMLSIRTNKDGRVKLK